MTATARADKSIVVAGLPILAIFGIIILFGAMALVSTLFSRLELSDRNEALALPPGAIRAMRSNAATTAASWPRCSAR